jgi:hypothetical protein
MEGKWAEMVVPNLRYYSIIFWGANENQEKSVKTVGLYAGI